MKYVAYVGVDWADQKHDYAVVTDDRVTESGTFSSKPEDIHGWVGRLRERYAGGTIVVAMEQSRGALLYALSRYDFLALVPLNPRAVSAYRDSLHLSGAKDDPVDAELIRDFAMNHLPKLRVWRAEDAATRKLRLLVEHRRNLVGERTSHVQALVAALKQYFPQALLWFGTRGWRLRAFIAAWPTLEAARRASADQLRGVIGGRWSDERLAALIEQLRIAVPLTSDTAIIDALVLRVGSINDLLETLDDQVDRYDQAIEALWTQHDERELFESLPGAGPVLAPRLAVAFGSDRGRFADAADMQNYSGTSPVTVRSGKRHTVHARWQRPVFLHQTFHEFAESSIPHSRWALAYYRQQRERGLAHRAAIRALAFRWIRVIYACWANRTRYDEATYLNALARRGSPLHERLAA